MVNYFYIWITTSPFKIMANCIFRSEYLLNDVHKPLVRSCFATTSEIHVHHLLLRLLRVCAVHIAPVACVLYMLYLLRVCCTCCDCCRTWPVPYLTCVVHVAPVACVQYMLRLLHVCCTCCACCVWAVHVAPVAWALYMLRLLHVCCTCCSCCRTWPVHLEDEPILLLLLPEATKQAPATLRLPWCQPQWIRCDPLFPTCALLFEVYFKNELLLNFIVKLSAQDQLGKSHLIYSVSILIYC